ncbi:MAG: M28 family peptidase [Ferruginibacter sp.]|nr:M28 family peptidase [Cytophagales bacterium]
MKKIGIALLAAQWALTVQAQPATADKATEYAQMITAEDLLKHLRILASDSLEGRNTGEIGQKMAADYIAHEFFDYGLTPLIARENGAASYYQSFELVRERLDSAILEVNGKEVRFSDDFLFFSRGTVNETLNAPVVFAGYGLEEANYSDYARVDVKDKIALVFLGEPRDQRGNSLVTGKRSEYTHNRSATLLKKEALARQKGAKRVFFVDELGAYFGGQRLSYVNFIKGDRIGFENTTGGPTAPNVILSVPAAAAFLGVSAAKLRKQAARLGKKRKSRVKERAQAAVRLAIVRNITRVETENVLGFVEGSDKKDEVLVVTAHYDHLGKQGNVVYNGANDDGSGTVAVLELAQAFARAKGEGNGPRRSILFMTVTGEEKGLLGSEYYTAHPVLPLEKTIANLNIDMIGRIDSAHRENPDYIYVIGSDKLSSELHQISEEANRKYVQLNLDYRYNDPGDPNRFYYRSDHYNFAKYRIPVAFYFNGVHEDYHQPTDDVEKMDFGKAEKITRLVFYTAWELANREGRIKVDSAKP